MPDHVAELAWITLQTDPSKKRHVAVAVGIIIIRACERVIADVVLCR